MTAVEAARGDEEAPPKREEASVHASANEHKVIQLTRAGLGTARRVAIAAEAGNGPRPYPVVSATPRLPMMIADEILDYYGWVFCQGGFQSLGMTFEGFLAVVAAVSPAGLTPEYDLDDLSCLAD